MANLTHVDARNVHGTNPQYLIEKITLSKVWESRYWKEKLFAVNSEDLVEVASELIAAGGTYGGNRKPSQFLCCLAKLLQLQPEKDIILEFITQDDFKYIRVLGAAYLRLVGNALDIYHYLEPLLLDWRKIRYRGTDGKYSITHVDDMIDKLLTEERFFDVILPRIPTRLMLEQQGKLAPRKSQLEDLDNFDVDPEDTEKSRKRVKSEERRSRSDSRGRRRRRRDRSRSRGRRRRSRSRSRGRRRRSDSREDDEDKGEMKRFEKKSLSVKETNKMRVAMGLAPLK